VEEPPQTQSAPEAAPAPSRRELVREVAFSFTGSLAITSVLYRLRFLPLVGQNLHALVGLAFLLIPISILQRRGARFEDFGIALGGLLGERATGGLLAFPRDLAVAFARHWKDLLGEIAFALAVMSVIVVPFFFGFRIYWHTGAFRFHLTREFASVSFAQLVVVALPEEFFYRGYVQTRLGQILPKRFRLLGSDYGVHVIVTSVLFALGHFLVDFNPERLGVFFPALLFGWIRERRGGIGASVFVHALCNVAADVLVIGYGI
jgi:hypothetical protein